MHTTRTSPTRHVLVLLAALAAVAAVTVGSPASASIEHPAVVSEDPVDYTPHLVDDGGPPPLALAVAELGPTMYVGGRFGAVENADRSTISSRDNIVALNANTGAINAAFAPSIDGSVYALLAVGSSVYVGGSFETVNGTARPAIAKLDATTGALDTAFQPSAIPGGRVSEIRLVDGRLLVGGTFKRNLVALNPNTGRNTGYINIAIDGRVPLSTSKTEVYRFAVNPAGTRLVGVGNFTSVGGQNRSRAFMLNLDASATSLSTWYYPPLTDKCRSNTPTRQAYLDDVDFSPDGSYFVFVSTGFVPALDSQIGTHVCDAAARFETNVLAPTEPTWINYTGGDTLHSVAVTGAAVYVQGHNRWLDNPQGRDSCDPATGCVERKGLGAIDPDSGFALPWNPGKPAAQGGQDFLATADGLWVVSDSRRFNGEYHRGIAFAPLP